MSAEVSVLVACRAGEEQGFERSLASVREQDVQAEIVVAAEPGMSADGERELERAEAAGVLVLRLPVTGVTACLNAGIENSTGAYVLPLEAGSTLAPGAIAAGLARLREAGDDVVFAYPAVETGGERREPPAYNLVSLLRGNYCHLSSLIDRRALGGEGVRYSERGGEAVSSAEYGAWDLVLSLAERGMHGVPAPGLVVRTSAREGVQPWHADVAAEMRLRHPALFSDVAIKARWAPAISLIELAPGDGSRESLDEAVARQTCRDIELIFGERGLGAAVDAARGRLIVATSGMAGELLSDRAFAERLLRGYRDTDPYALVLADGGAAARWEQCDPSRFGQAHTVAWHPARFDGAVEVDDSMPVASLAAALADRAVALQWRHWGETRASAAGDTAGSGRTSEVRLSGAEPSGPGEAIERAERGATEPRLPAAPRDPLPASPGLPAWTPRDTALITRYRHEDRWLVAEHGTEPPGFEIDFWLGAVDRLPRRGTVALIADAHGDCRSAPADAQAGPGERLLGYAESEQFFPLEPIVAGRDAAGNPLVAAGEADPCTGTVADGKTLGYLQPFPPPPRQRAVGVWSERGVTGLVRSLDRAAGRHRYAAGCVAAGEPAGELGALAANPAPGLIPLSLTADGTVGSRAPVVAESASPAAAARWAAAPLAWRDAARPAARARAAAGRLRKSAQQAVARKGGAGGDEHGEVVGYLHRDPAPADLGGPELMPLLYAVHPITGDQLLTTNPHEPGDLGYGEPELLGYLVPAAPVTGELGLRQLTIPWASRFGERVRT